MKNKGFTLIELLFAVGILLLAIAATSSIFFTGRRSAETYDAEFQVREYARIAMNRISGELRLSRPIMVRINNNIGWLLPELRNGAVVNFQIPVGAYNTSLNLTVDYDLRWGSADREGDFITYFINPGGELRRGIYTLPNAGGLVDQLVISNIANITFDRDILSQNLINIKVIAISGSANYTLDSNITLRNS